MPKIVKILGGIFTIFQKAERDPFTKRCYFAPKDEDPGCIYSRSNDAGMVIGRVEHAGPAVYHGH